MKKIIKEIFFNNIGLTCNFAEAFLWQQDGDSPISFGKLQVDVTALGGEISPLRDAAHRSGRNDKMVAGLTKCGSSIIAVTDSQAAANVGSYPRSLRN